MERGIADGQHGYAVDLDTARLHQIEGKDVRHEIDRGRGVAKRVHQLLDAWGIAHRQCDVDGIDRMALNECDNVLAFSRELLAGLLRESIRAAEVEKPHEGAGSGAPRDATGQFCADFIGANDNVTVVRRSCAGQSARAPVVTDYPVSYTHLTLPTIYSV